MSRTVANKALGLSARSSLFLPGGCAALLGELSEPGNLYSNFNQNRYVVNLGIEAEWPETLSILRNDTVPRLSMNYSYTGHPCSLGRYARDAIYMYYICMNSSQVCKIAGTTVGVFPNSGDGIPRITLARNSSVRPRIISISSQKGHYRPMYLK